MFHFLLFLCLCLLSLYLPRQSVAFLFNTSLFRPFSASSSHSSIPGYHSHLPHSSRISPPSLPWSLRHTSSSTLQTLLIMRISREASVMLLWSSASRKEGNILNQCHFSGKLSRGRCEYAPAWFISWLKHYLGLSLRYAVLVRCWGSCRSVKPLVQMRSNGQNYYACVLLAKPPVVMVKKWSECTACYFRSKQSIIWCLYVAVKVGRHSYGH